jgi:predicted RNA-binding protein YlxR (DUF448 family)
MDVYIIKFVDVHGQVVFVNWTTEAVGAGCWVHEHTVEGAERTIRRFYPQAVIKYLPAMNAPRRLISGTI